MAISSHQHNNSLRRKNRTRAVLGRNKTIPRLTVFRSLRHIYAQIIDDQSGKTLASANDASVKKGTKVEVATIVGEAIAEAAKTKKITAVRFDRGSYKYHGRIAALAEGARKGGLKF